VVACCGGLLWWPVVVACCGGLLRWPDVWTVILSQG